MVIHMALHCEKHVDWRHQGNNEELTASYYKYRRLAQDYFPESKRKIADFLAQL
ncbi:hypothetical protein ABIE66_005676 [Peribacillus sp. B2I2]|uniref:hypothetical protein n=1 Tax=unclassified Peribacillus TaxID=2675266 RepID=UPI0025A080FD|nr:hypothetical protein [Peribacillus sp. ACCC06369]